jgi:predicted enzyme related to lactoylglutathione lyase
MFAHLKAFSSFSVKDTSEAKDFYTNVLGLTVKEEDMGLLYVSFADGSFVMIYPKGEGHTPATFTVLNFQVETIEKAIDELVAKGVKFENYDTEFIKTNEKGIATFGNRQMAWFQDPSGNILSLIEEK